MKKNILLVLLVFSGLFVEVIPSNPKTKQASQRTWFQYFTDTWWKKGLIAALVGGGTAAYANRDRINKVLEERRQRNIDTENLRQQQIDSRYVNAQNVGSLASSLEQQNINNENVRQQQKDYQYAKEPSMLERASKWISSVFSPKQETEDLSKQRSEELKKLYERGKSEGENLKQQASGVFDWLKAKKEELSQKIANKTAQGILDSQKKMEEVEKSKSVIPSTVSERRTLSQGDYAQLENKKTALKEKFEEKRSSLTSPTQINQLERQYKTDLANIEKPFRAQETQMRNQELQMQEQERLRQIQEENRKKMTYSVNKERQNR